MYHTLPKLLELAAYTPKGEPVWTGKPEYHTSQHAKLNIGEASRKPTVTARLIGRN